MMETGSRVDVLAGLESWKRFYGFSRFLLSPADIVKTLQVEPKLGACPEKVRQP